MYVRQQITSHFQAVWFLQLLASFYDLGIFVYLTIGTVKKGKGKVILLQARCGPEGG